MNNTHTSTNSILSPASPTNGLRSNRAFTLIELLVVILILGILLAIALPTFLNQQNKAKDSSVKVQLNTTYKEAKATAVAQNSNYTTATFSTANLATAVQKGEPALTVVALPSGTNDASTPGTIGICSQTSGTSLYAVETSASGLEYLMTGGPGIPFQIAPGNCAGFTTSSSDSGSGSSQSVAQLSIIDGQGMPGTPVAGPATASSLNNPLGAGVDAAGDVFVSDLGNNYIEQISSSGTLSIIGGNGHNNYADPSYGTATNSPLATPTYLTADSSGDVFFTLAQTQMGNQVFEIKNGSLSLYAGNGAYNNNSPTPGQATNSPLGGSITGLAVDSAGDLYIGASQYITKVTPDGTLSIVAGSSSTIISGMALDPAGNLYYGVSGTIVKMTPSGITTTVAGNGNTSNNGTPVLGPASSSPLGNIYDMKVNAAGSIFFTDGYLANDVYEVSGGILSVAVGTNASGGPTAGPATSSSLNAPAGLALDSSGDLFIADQDNSDLEKVTGLN